MTNDDGGLDGFTSLLLVLALNPPFSPSLLTLISGGKSGEGLSPIIDERA